MKIFDQSPGITTFILPPKVRYQVMMKTTSLFLTAFSAMMVFSSSVWAQSRVGNCESQFAGADLLSPNVMTEIKSLDQLPKKIFVAQSADFLISEKVSGLKLWGRQSFVSGEEKVVCATLRKSSETGFSMYAPTLIDLSGAHTVGNSFWQFHMIATEQRAGLWNQRSRFSARSGDFLARLQEAGVRVYGEIISSSQYQLHFVRENDGASEHLRIRYDLTDDLP
jgi:hypothetical protein